MSDGDNKADALIKGILESLKDSEFEKEALIASNIDNIAARAKKQIAEVKRGLGNLDGENLELLKAIEAQLDEFAKTGQIDLSIFKDAVAPTHVVHPGLFSIVASCFCQFGFSSNVPRQTEELQEEIMRALNGAPGYSFGCFKLPEKIRKIPGLDFGWSIFRPQSHLGLSAVEANIGFFHGPSIETVQAIYSKHFEAACNEMENEHTEKSWPMGFHSGNGLMN